MDKVETSEKVPCGPEDGTSVGGMAFADLLAMSVDDIRVSLVTLSTEELAALHAAEVAGKSRKTLLAAIDAEDAARKLAQAELEVQALAVSLGVKVYTASEVKEMVGTLEARIAILEGGAANTAGEASKEPALLLDMTDAPEWPLRYVAFVDAQGGLLADLPALEFDEAAFVRAAPIVMPAASAKPDATTISLVLSEAIAIPEGGRRAELAQVWLLDSARNGVAVCHLVVPLPVGSGTSARLPAGSLRFDGIPAPGAQETTG